MTQRQRMAAMIREIGRCPYCGEVPAGVDDDLPAFVLAPDRGDGRPCRHLAFVLVSLEAYRVRRGDAVPARSGHWLWVRDEGLIRLPDGPVDPLSEYLDLLACGHLAGDMLPVTEYQLSGGTAGVRESQRPGSGEFPLAVARGPRLAASIDGWAICSPAPEILVVEARRLAATDEPPAPRPK